MARPKANVARQFIEKPQDAFDMLFSTVDAECAFDVNRGFINRLVKDGIIVPYAAGAGAGVSRQFNIWNMVQIKLASRLDSHFKWITVGRLVKCITSDLRMNFFTDCPAIVFYNYLFTVRVNPDKGPFEDRDPEVWEKLPALFYVKLIEDDDGNFYPQTDFFSRVMPQSNDFTCLFDRGVNHVVNMHTIAWEALEKLILYDEVRKGLSEARADQ